MSKSVEPTIGHIAQQLGVPIHRVQYIIKSRNIQPVSIAGQARIFSTEAIRQISAALAGVAANRQKGMANAS
jgi:DNA-binding transcriptional MerR regulator